MILCIAALAVLAGFQRGFAEDQETLKAEMESLSQQDLENIWTQARPPHRGVKITVVSRSVAEDSKELKP